MSWNHTTLRKSPRFSQRSDSTPPESFARGERHHPLHSSLTFQSALRGQAPSPREDPKNFACPELCGKRHVAHAKLRWHQQSQRRLRTGQPQPPVRSDVGHGSPGLGTVPSPGVTQGRWGAELRKGFWEISRYLNVGTRPGTACVCSQKHRSVLRAGVCCWAQSETPGACF